MPVLQIIVASTRDTRIGDRVGGWIKAEADRHGGFEIDVADLKEIDLPMFDEPKHPRLGEYEHDHTKAWSERVRRADGFVIVMPEYNHGYPATIKNAIDYLSAEWRYKPAGFVSYGGVSAGLRGVQGLKPVLDCLSMVPVTESVHIPFVGKMIAEDGSFTSNEGLDASAQTMLERIAFWIERNRDIYVR